MRPASVFPFIQLSNFRELLARKRIRSGPMEEKEKQRLYGFFMRKGFASADILAVFREAEQESF